MTFRTGFAVTQELSLSDWRLENAAGKPLVGSIRTPRRAHRGTMIEIDIQRGRARMPFGRGVYLATNLTPELRRSVVNLAECATRAIDEIMKAQDADMVVRAASLVDREQPTVLVDEEHALAVGDVGLRERPAFPCRQGDGKGTVLRQRGKCLASLNGWFPSGTSTLMMWDSTMRLRVDHRPASRTSGRCSPTDLPITEYSERVG